MSFPKKVAGIFQMPSAESLATSGVSNGSGYGTRSVPATLSSNIRTQLVVLVEQTSGHEGVLKRATSIMEPDMRWRPLLSMSLEAFMSPPVQRDGKSAKKPNRRELSCVPFRLVRPL